VLDGSEAPPVLGSPRPPSDDEADGAAGVGASGAFDDDDDDLNGAMIVLLIELANPQPLSLGATCSPPLHRSPGINL